MTSPFTIKASAAPRTAEIFIYGDIGEGWDDETVSAREFVRDLAALDADTLTVRVNSYGGSVTDGLAIYNALRRHPAAVHVEIDGIAASIASLVAMAGDTVQMAENALLMIHAPWGVSIGNSANMRDYADVLDKYAGAMANAYAARTDVDAEYILGLLIDGEDHYFSADEAASAGLIDAVTAALPVAAHIHKVFDLSRYTRFRAAAAATHQEGNMPTDNKPAADAVDLEAIKAQTLKEERERRQAVAAKFEPFADREGMAELKAQCLDDDQVTSAVAGERILAKLAEGAEPIQGHVVTRFNERDVRRADAVDAVLARAGVAGVKADSSNPYRGYRLLDIARECVEASGVSTRGMDQLKIVAAAFTQSTSDFPVLLEEAMHKTLQASYGVAALTWSRFCATGSVSDFRAHNRYRIGSLGNLDTVSELGEFTNKTIPDGEKASISAKTVGNIINLSRQTIINDDLSAFLGLSNMLGRSAARTVEAEVYKLLAENAGLGPVMGDSKTLFHADHGNIGSAGALAVVSIEDARVKLASQMDVGGNDYLDLRPAVLLVPMGLGGTARVINAAEYDPDTSGKLQRPNMVRGLFRDIVDTPRLSGTRFYTFADPSEAPVIEVAFLDGNQSPYLEIQDGFDVDGAQYKVRLDFGVGAIDYRGAVTNAGA